MKKEKKSNVDLKNIKLSFFLSLFFVVLIMFMSVGFALYNQVLKVDGQVDINAQGDFKITNVRKVQSSNTNDAIPSWTDNSINFNLSFLKNEEDPTYSASYDVTFTNSTFYERLLSSFNINLSVEQDGVELGTIDYEIEGYNNEDVINPMSEKTYRINITFTPIVDSDTYDINGEVEVESNEKATGEFTLSSISPTTGSIKNNNLLRINVVLNSTYQTDREIRFVCNSDKVEVVDSNGNSLDPSTISANSSNQEFVFYLKAKDDALFPEDTYTTSLSVTSTGLPSLSLGNVTLDVDKHEEYVDTSAPTISGVTATISNEVGVVNLTWNATDDFSGIKDYTILVCDNDNNIIKTINNVTEKSYLVNDLSNGTNASKYKFKVYGTDNLGNTATETDINNATTSSGYCSATEVNSYQWVFSVTRNLNNLSFSGDNTVNIGNNYTCRLTANQNYELPNNITVTMNGENYNNYTYNNYNGNITINNVTGNVVITANGVRNAICLIEGTKVLLANNTYKNIEDISYDDLLAVWDYNKGKIVNEYPVWIEKTSRSESYQKTTFSDGTSIGTSGDHAMYNIDLGMFVSVEDKNNFHVGSTIAKIENGKVKKVKIKNIETINKKVKLYHIISTYYYNIISNDYLTTDRNLMISNLYGFSNNITWPNNIRNDYLASGDIYKYSEFKDIMPYYMFKGLRVSEGKYLVNNSFISYDELKLYLKLYPGDSGYYKKVETNNNGKRLWMVTTSKDKVNDKNKDNFKLEEGSYYTFKKYKNVSKYCDNISGKCYSPGDSIKVHTGMHFVAK